MTGARDGWWLALLVIGAAMLAGAKVQAETRFELRPDGILDSLSVNRADALRLTLRDGERSTRATVRRNETEWRLHAGTFDIAAAPPSVPLNARLALIEEIRGDYRKRASVIGGLLGGMTGAVWVASASSYHLRWGVEDSRDELRAGWAFAFGGGAVVGAIVGSLIGRQHPATRICYEAR